eukprot:TRINITY_DN8002_c0_g1_i2.p1 TRINITY_DN8002_c0_g1~~TRINITY_DN8002_c0_g1_i2.p1  ORF type:complete len:101 (+),score=9.85 TRINITY_DN8002_c0_g1_i2:243-545(+)
MIARIQSLDGQKQKAYLFDGEWEDTHLMMMQKLPPTITYLDLHRPPQRCWSDHITHLVIRDAPKTSAEAFRNVISLYVDCEIEILLGFHHFLEPIPQTQH